MSNRKTAELPQINFFDFQKGVETKVTNLTPVEISLKDTQETYEGIINGEKFTLPTHFALIKKIGVAIGDGGKTVYVTKGEMAPGKNGNSSFDYKVEYE